MLRTQNGVKISLKFKLNYKQKLTTQLYWLKKLISVKVSINCVRIENILCVEVVYIFSIAF